MSTPEELELIGTVSEIAATAIAASVLVAVASSAAAAMAGAVAGAVAGAAGGGAGGAAAGAAGGGAGGGAAPLLLGAQRFTMSAGLGANASAVQSGVASSLGWVSGEVSFFSSASNEPSLFGDGRRLDTVESASFPLELAMLLNLLVTFVIALTITVASHLGICWMWRRVVNRKHYAWQQALTEANGDTTQAARRIKSTRACILFGPRRKPKIPPAFFPYPKSLVWPTPFFFATCVFATGLTRASVRLIAVYSTGPGWERRAATIGLALAITTLAALLSLVAGAVVDVWCFFRHSSFGRLIKWTPAKGKATLGEVADPWFRLRAVARIRLRGLLLFASRSIGKRSAARCPSLISPRVAPAPVVASTEALHEERLACANRHATPTSNSGVVHGRKVPGRLCSGRAADLSARIVRETMTTTTTTTTITTLYADAVVPTSSTTLHEAPAGPPIPAVPVAAAAPNRTASRRTAGEKPDAEGGAKAGGEGGATTGRVFGRQAGGADVGGQGVRGGAETSSPPPETVDECSPMIRHAAADPRRWQLGPPAEVAEHRLSLRDARVRAAERLARCGHRDRRSGAFGGFPQGDLSEPARTERLLAAPFRVRHRRAADAWQAREGYLLFRVNGGNPLGVGYRLFVLTTNLLFGTLAGLQPLLPAGSWLALGAAGGVLCLQLGMAVVCLTLLPDADRMISRFAGMQFLLEGISMCILLRASVGSAEEERGSAIWITEYRDVAFAIALSAMAVPVMQLLEQRFVTPTVNIVLTRNCNVLALCAAAYSASPPIEPAATCEPRP